jgi:uncharacterized membrane protein
MTPVAHSHSHRAARDGGVVDGDVAIGTRVRTGLLGFLVLAFVATVAGVVAWWPDHDAVERVRAAAPYTAPGVTTPDAVIVRVGPACPEDHAGSQDCDVVQVRVTEGAGQGDEPTLHVPPEVASSGIGPGDRMELFRTPPRNGEPASYAFSSVGRTLPLLWLALTFVVVVLLVAGRRGVMAIVGLVVSGATL